MRYKLTVDGLSAKKAFAPNWVEIRWTEVTAFERRWNWLWSAGEWVLASPGREIPISRWEDRYAEIQQAILTHVPPELIEAPTARQYSGRKAGNARKFKTGSGFHLFSGVAGILAFASIGVAFAFTAATHFWSLLGALLALGLAIGAAIHFYSDVWDWFFGYLLITDDSILLKSRRGGKEIAWSDLRMYESLRLSGGRGGPTYRATFVSSSTSFSLTNFDQAIVRLDRAVAERAPDEAFTLLVNQPGSPIEDF